MTDPSCPVERALERNELEIIRLACSSLGIPPDRWRRVPSLKSFWEILAARRLVDAYTQAGHSEERARNAAAAVLQIPAATIETRERRCFEHAFGLGGRADCQNEVGNEARQG